MNTLVPQIRAEGTQCTDQASNDKTEGGFFAEAFGVVTRPWMTIKRLSRVPDTSAWVLAMLAVAIVIVGRLENVMLPIDPLLAWLRAVIVQPV